LTRTKVELVKNLMTSRSRKCLAFNQPMVFLNNHGCTLYLNPTKKTNKMNNQSKSKAPPNFIYKITELNHDNKLMAVIRNPYKLLRAAGLKPGLKVLDVGCGPGAFTIPASEIVGENGFLYAVDIHPLAIKRIKEKIVESGIVNIKPILTNASNMRLLKQEIDLVFIFGLPNISGGMANVFSEINRVLKPGGILSFERFLRSEKKLIANIENEGFVFTERKGRILLFTK
jgi:SAM-dependent methyltransferase